MHMLISQLRDMANLMPIKVSVTEYGKFILIQSHLPEWESFNHDKQIPKCIFAWNQQGETLQREISSVFWILGIVDFRQICK